MRSEAIAQEQGSPPTTANGAPLPREAPPLPKRAADYPSAATSQGLFFPDALQKSGPGFQVVGHREVAALGY